MKSPSNTKRDRIKRLRSLILAAEQEGVAPGDLVLRLTLGDVYELKRDRSVAIEEISFVGGVMRFLGVQVEEGGVEASSLERRTA